MIIRDVIGFFLHTRAWRGRGRARARGSRGDGSLAYRGGRVVGGDRRIPSYGGEYRYAREDNEGRRRAAAAVRVVRWVREGGRRAPLEGGERAAEQADAHVQGSREVCRQPDPAAQRERSERSARTMCTLHAGPRRTSLCNTSHAVAVTCYERARVIASIAQHSRLSHFIAKYRAVSRLRYCEKFPLD